MKRVELVQLVKVTDSGNDLSAFLGNIYNNQIEITMDEVLVSIELMEEIWELWETVSYNTHKGKKSSKPLSPRPGINVLKIKEKWEAHDRDHDFDKWLETLEKMKFITKGALVIPEGTYQVAIGKFVIVEAELHEDFEIGSERSVNLYPTGLVELPGDENPLMACQLNEAERLECTGFLLENGNIDDSLKVRISTLD